MRRPSPYWVAAIVCLSLIVPSIALSAGTSDYYRSYTEEKAAVAKNGADAAGRVFTRTYDPEPEELLVLVDEKAFMLKTTGLFMQRMGLINVYPVGVKSMDDTVKPVIIDCTVGPGIPGSLLEELGGGAYAFTVKADRYEVRLAGPVVREPKMFVNLLGTLLSRNERVGTRSEGPEYYLRTDDGREIHVVKNALPWKKDKVLHKMVDREVWIPGALVDSELVYKEIHPNLK
jgi:hypothetical protein